MKNKQLNLQLPRSINCTLSKKKKKPSGSSIAPKEYLIMQEMNELWKIWKIMNFGISYLFFFVGKTRKAERGKWVTSYGYSCGYGYGYFYAFVKYGRRALRQSGFPLFTDAVGPFTLGND
jgi:hypothetical protein